MKIRVILSPNAVEVYNYLKNSNNKQDTSFLDILDHKKYNKKFGYKYR